MQYLVVLAHSVEDVGVLMCAARELVKYQWSKDKTPTPLRGRAGAPKTTLRPSLMSCQPCQPWYRLVADKQHVQELASNFDSIEARCGNALCN